MNRRNFLAAGALTAGAALCAKVAAACDLHRKGAAHNQKMEKTDMSGQAPAYYRTKVGSIEVTSILDGGMRLPNAALLGASDQKIREQKDKFFIPQGDDFPAFISGFLIKDSGKLTLVDTGAKGYAKTTGHLMERLGLAGVDADDIHDIVMTHLHPDHAGGLLADDGGMAFPKARLRISEEELDFWTNADNRAKMPEEKRGMFDGVVKNLAPYKKADRIETFKLGGDLGGGLASVDLRGHTPGHGGVRMSSGKDQLLIWADIVHIPAVQFNDPSVGIGFDADPEQAKIVRKKIFDEASTDRVRIMGSHLWHPPVGHVVKRRAGDGYAFLTQIWETDV